MTTYAEDQKWPIPEKFRVSAKLTDEAAFALLQQCDAEQRALAERINAPFTRNTPQERIRSTAPLAIRGLLAVKRKTPEQREMLAEAYAALGRYDLAASTSKLHAKHYKAIWDAVFRDDADWCKHPPKHRFVKENIFSVRHGREVALLKCNACGMLNAADTPDDLSAQSAYHRQFRGATKGMTIADARAWHEQNVRKT